VIAKVYAEKFNALPFVDLVACADLDGERAAEFAAAHDIPRVLPVGRTAERSRRRSDRQPDNPASARRRQSGGTRCRQVGFTAKSRSR
jgi:hypothetical protein